VLISEHEHAKSFAEGANPAFVQIGCGPYARLMSFAAGFFLKNSVIMGADVSRSHRKPIVLLANREAGEVKELETALYSAGYQVVLARSDRETLEKVHAHGPDAVLLDREVGSGGYTLCETLRRDSALSPAAPILLSQDE